MEVGFLSKLSTAVYSLRMGTSKRKGYGRRRIPGPGEYNTRGKIEKEGYTYVIGSKTSMNEYKNRNPGPGSY